MRWTPLLCLVAALLLGCGDKPDPVCGDGRQNGDEECDGEDLAGTTCADLGYAGTGLSCDDQCRFDIRTCSGCGNNAVSAAEECDGTDLAGRTCEDLGFTGGQLACDTECRYNLRYCDGGCGNGRLEVPELCDGTALGNLTCRGLGYADGTLGCLSTCVPDIAGCGPPLAPLGASCTTDASCLTNNCLTEPEHGLPGGTCTDNCYDPGTGLTCTDPDAICGCADPDCVLRSCLLSCTPGGPTPCRAGYGCVDQGEGEGACVPRCTDDSQCVITHTCDTTPGSPTIGYCRIPPEICTGGVDDDLDGRTDCADPDCVASCPAGELCDNGSDDDGDGFSDCDDGECVLHTHCTGVSCSAAAILPTDATLMGQSNGQAGSVDLQDDWCGTGANGWTGPEHIWSLTVTANTFVSVAVQNAATDVDLLVLTDGRVWGDCNPQACIAQSTRAGTGLEDVTFEARPGHTYYVVVDGWQGAVATFDLAVTTVPGEDCANGTDDDGDGLSDCADPSCFGLPGCLTELHCGDAADNDGDGDVDCADPDCAAHGWCTSTPILQEDFSAWPPPGWTITDGGGPGATWQQCTVCSETLENAVGAYAMVSSDLAGPTWPLDEGLYTPPLDLTGYTAVWLQFSHHFENYGLPNHGDFGMVEVSYDATNWAPVQLWTDTAPGRTELLDLTGPLAGQSPAWIRFRYVDGGLWAWYWAIDTVTVAGN